MGRCCAASPEPGAGIALPDGPVLWAFHRGAYDEAPLPTTSQPGATGEAGDRYGDVPLGVESAWPTRLLPATV